jgi:hypothetical protein
VGQENWRPESSKARWDRDDLLRRYQYPALHLPHFARPYFAYAITISDTVNIVDRRDGTAMRNYRGRVGRFAISGSISYSVRLCFSNVSIYMPLLRMQSRAWRNAVDEEQDIRNDGSKSLRSHRAFQFSVILNGTFFDGWLAYGDNFFPCAVPNFRRKH